MSEVAKFSPSERAWHMRKAGFSVLDIASEFDQTTAEVISLIRSYQTQMAASYSTDDRQALVMMELERLDDLQVKVNPFLDDPENVLKAVDSTLKIMNHRMKLTGLDQLTPTDETTRQNILVIGDNAQSFMEALANGRRQPVMASHVQDDEADEAQSGEETS